MTIFGENKDYIIAITQDQPTEYIDNRLTILDSRAVRAFYIGLFLTIGLGVATSWTLINKGDSSMTDKKENTTQTILSEDNRKAIVVVDVEKSVGGARSMAPKQSSSSENTPATISVRGAESMKPPKKTDDK